MSEECSSITNKAQGPVGCSAVEISAGIRSGKWSVQEVVEAHIDRIEQVNPRLNAVIWPLFGRARQEAERADKILAQSRALGRGSAEELPPLFGLPITIKDQFFVQDTPVSIGLAHRSHTPLDKEGSLIKRLREQGAIILGKTNVPQLLISHECEHGHFGHANNPWDIGRTPGGSSGGEAAIIAAGGSPLGLGGDMGGSLRIPAHFCGITALKPTGGRFPNDDTPLLEGFAAGFVGFEGFTVQPGPMARNVEDLTLAMSCLLSRPLKTPLPLPPVPWPEKQELSLASLNVGVYTNDQFFTPSPAIARAVEESARVLESHGARVVPFEVPNAERALQLYLSLLCSDGGRWITDSLAGDRPIPDVKSLLKASRLSDRMRGLVHRILKGLGQDHAAKMILSTGRCDAASYWDLTAERSRYRARFLEEMDKKNIDLIVCPPHGLPAVPHNSNRNGLLGVAASYAALYNLLDMPAGVVQASTIGEEEKCTRPKSRDKVETDARKVEMGSAGLPVGVQVVGRHWREEQVLAVMETLETHFRGLSEYPRTPTMI